MNSRREFVRKVSCASAGLALAGSWACSESTKKILILGGTGFIGPHMVSYAIERGHDVTVFTRGRSSVELPSEVEHLLGDRNDDYSALMGREWDTVLDNNAQDYRWVQKSTELLRDVVEHYVFVSSISAYAVEGGFGWENAHRILTEPIIDEGYPTIEGPEGWKYGDDAPYGLMKALSEKIVQETFPGRATVVRPGLIVGPRDPTDRFTYWPVRMAEGGEVLAPGNPEHAIQVIDQRDLTEWIVRMAETKIVGEFNATGPAERMSMQVMLDQVGSSSSSWLAGEVNPYELTWVPEVFLEEQGLSPWRDFPAWTPGDPLQLVDIDAAIQAGLSFRPLSLTVTDTLDWWENLRPDQRNDPKAGMGRDKEREVLDLWRNQNLQS